MTLDEYIVNPLGKGGAVLNSTARESIRGSYIDKFNKLMVREHGRIEYHLYYVEKKNKFYAWFKIPSETIEKFYYDVVFEFSANEDIKQAGENLFKYDVKFYANDPAFVYTYAYVFNHNGLLIKDLIPRMSRRAIKEKPDEKNQYMQVGYVKSLYFAYLAMLNRNFNKKDTFISLAAASSNIVGIINGVEDADAKIDKRQRAEEEKNKNKRRDKEAKKNASKNLTKLASSTKNSNKIVKTGSVKNINKISAIKKSTKKK